jgi:hypothetical protein
MESWRCNCCLASRSSINLFLLRNTITMVNPANILFIIFHYLQSHCQHIVLLWLLYVQNVFVPSSTTNSRSRIKDTRGHMRWNHWDVGKIKEQYWQLYTVSKHMWTGAKSKHFNYANMAGTNNESCMFGTCILVTEYLIELLMVQQL